MPAVERERDQTAGTRRALLGARRHRRCRRLRARQRPAHRRPRRRTQRRRPCPLRRWHRHRPVAHARRPRDPATRTVRVQGGATLGDLDRETHAFGLAVPCGIVPKTGIGGLTLGGGVGWLVRKFGMSIDNLLSCQVVTADGKVLTASASENDDLFWALRGGGGNFGVVASFEFQAHPVQTVLGGLLLYPRAAAVAVIRHFRGYMASAPDELTAYVALLHGPDGAPLVGVDPLLLRRDCRGPNGSSSRSGGSATRLSTPSRNYPSPPCRRCSRHPFRMATTIIGSRRCSGNCQTTPST